MLWAAVVFYSYEWIDFSKNNLLFNEDTNSLSLNSKRFKKNFHIWVFEIVKKFLIRLRTLLGFFYEKKTAFAFPSQIAFHVFLLYNLPTL